MRPQRYPLSTVNSQLNEVREAPASYLVELAMPRVRPGYKQTNLGIIPEDWNVIPMGQVSECLIGLTYSPLDVRDFGTLVLRSSNVQNGRLAFDDNVYVDMEIPQRAITRKNDILICVRNGSRQLIGKCALIDGKTAGSAFGAFMSVLRSDSAKFLFFEFQSSILKRQIDEVMGATINQITNKNMAAFKVIWPPTKAEQQAIAEALSDADALSMRWSNSSPRSATSNKARCRNCSPVKSACRDSVGSGS